MGGVWAWQIKPAATFLKGLLKTLNHALDNESLGTLMAVVELVIHPRSPTLETVKDSKSEVPLSKNNLLTMKTNVTMSGEFSKPDVYSKRRW